MHAPHDVNNTGVNVTSSGDYDVDTNEKVGVEDVMDHDGESTEMIWKGMVVLAGIYLFFVTERLISVWRTSRRRRNKVYYYQIVYYHPRSVE